MEKIVMHIDMNSYFASVEQQANPFLRGQPIGVTGKRQERSVVAAASIEAKKLGVKTAMSSWEAKKICPTIQIIMGDPEKYAEITHRFNAIFREFADAVEQFSVDESFLDVTQSAQDYLGATVMAQMIKARLKEECGERITCSIGIGPNKLIAKLASELEKPDGLIVVRPKDVPALLDSVELTDFCGIGERTAAHLERLGVTTVEQLRDFPLHLLVREFKSYGYWLHDAAHGRDESEVSPLGKGRLRGVGGDDPKSVGHSYTLPRDAWDPLEVKRYLLGLCDKVAWRLRRDGFVARGVTTYIRYGDFSGQAEQHRFHEATADGLKLFRIAWSMVKKWLGDDKHEIRSMKFETNPKPEIKMQKSQKFRKFADSNFDIVSDFGFRISNLTKPVRLVGIAAGELTHGPEQPSLFPKDRKMAATLGALDRVQQRFGDRSWTRASLLNTSIKARASGFAYDHEL